MLRLAGARPSSSEKGASCAVAVKRFNLVEMTNSSTLKRMPSSLSINLLRFVALIAILPLAAAAQSSMKAIVVHSSGGPDVLKYEDAPRPQPKDDEVLIRVMAAAVNPVDVFIREGRSNQFPLIPGMDVAGGVEQAGNTVRKFKPGDAIYAYLSFEEQGGYAEFA